MDHRDVYLNSIQGQWKQGGSGQWESNRNPARPTEILGKLTKSTAADVDRATDAAQAALLDWSRKPRPERASILAKSAQIIRNKAESFAKMITREQGKNIAEARAEVQRAVRTLELQASMGLRASGAILPSSTSSLMVQSFRAPLGVVGIITPSESPLALPASRLGAILIEGNTAVLKPSSLAPGSAAMLVRVLEEAGLPPGVLNLVYGSGAVAGSALVQDRRISALSFTGCEANGLQISAQASRRPIPLELELGGKGAMVVLEGADLDRAADDAVASAFACAGQRATGAQRVWVSRGVHAALTERIVDRARSLRVGDGMAEPVSMGPLTDETSLKNFLEAVEEVRAAGARILCGGERVGTSSPESGYFAAPTVIDGLATSAKAFQDEIQGPLLAIAPIEGLDEALLRANEIRRLASCSIYAPNQEVAGRFMNAVKARLIAFNRICSEDDAWAGCLETSASRWSETRVLCSPSGL